MENIAIKKFYRETDKFLNRRVRVSGWIRTVRSSNTTGFMELNDGSFFKGLQIIFENKLENFTAITRATIGSAIEVEGILVESPGAGQSFEVKADRVEIIGLAAPDYPLQKKRHSFEFLRTIAHLRARSNTFSAVFRVRSRLNYAIHRFFTEKNFVYIHAPIITTSDCEGAGEMFRVTTLDPQKPPVKDDAKVDWTHDFFGKEAGLTVSGQLNAEAMSMSFRDVYTFGPTFRAENSNTTRHAAEFWMLEPEMAFADLKDDMNLAEEMVKYLIAYLKKHMPEELDFFNKFIDAGLKERLDLVLNSDFKRMTYSEAIDILLSAPKKFDYPVKWGIDLQTEHERYLTDEVFKKPVFVTDYPKEIKAFYMRLNDDGKTVAAMDLLVPGIGEMIGGSQREERIDILKSRMAECGLKEEDYWWYLDLRKYGGVKHAGFGLGFERAIMYFTGMENIRDVIPFPRVPKKADF
ncbi:asparagine--tRNA ligase [Candidatus Falkowbacteria bacterium RIFOXYB2_FULL_47_14]|uniref:Asparagine--tRNA ligase n=1 Tax=Candidatus Falkowbacteria bacterium RIFOXYA2_FULL_47_19 TaxID=1797994 RepID=A0A1F5SI81_9BACT|nr:MAG: asparagine--tRNA ligase [Candidatus Falkowbacteria bacterium RIFOXYA2_FULL_47_19]OGF35430.1 MAG: asparagine--tRNA ligase [Candidatus Falkowbacteria bacterium RIFOXYC2_FULL_46_15]OGF42578.1 MAG: asparagine--tRNA ligase [Candidatus Falkowbacteria bacterium RIFOXYB2_FULL_47_14]